MEWDGEGQIRKEVMVSTGALSIKHESGQAIQASFCSYNSDINMSDQVVFSHQWFPSSRTWFTVNHK